MENANILYTIDESINLEELILKVAKEQTQPIKKEMNVKKERRRK